MTEAPRTPGASVPSLSVALLRAALGATALAVVVEASLGAVGALGAALPIVTLGLAASAILFCRRAGRERACDDSTAAATRPTWSTGDGGAVAALVAGLLTRAWEGLHRTRFTYDVLSYHLHLPAAWRAAGRVGIVPTPFGDQAPAYAPSNAELIYQLALAATGNVRLAHAGQAPFAALACLAIVATARAVGASRAVAAGSALAFLLVPEVWQQATGGMTDLAVAAFFLATLPFLVRCGRAPAAADIVGLALALGLLVGTKYVGALLSLPLGVWALGLALRVARVRRRAPDRGRPRDARAAGAVGWALALAPVIVLASGGFWYLRNALVTGNPTFPVTLRLASWTLAPGLYDGAAMRAWAYHLPADQLQPLLEIFADTGWGFLASLIVAGGWSVWRRRPGWPLLLAASVAIGWAIIPYQQSRFFFSSWGIAAIMIAAAASAGAPSRAPLALALPIAAEALQFPTPARIVCAIVFGLAVVLEACPSERAAAWLTRAAAWPWSSRWRRIGVVVAAATGALACTGWARAYPGDQPYVIGDDHDAAWAFVRETLHGRRIAYAGSNVPLPLWGWRLDNQVRAINVAGDPDERLIERAPRDTRGQTESLTASPPVSAEPAPERAHPDRDAWLRNLAHHRIDTLFVASLYPEVRASMSHDGDGFPVERAWADQSPARFPILFATAGVRIYAVRRERAASDKATGRGAGPRP